MYNKFAKIIETDSLLTKTVINKQVKIDLL